MNSFFHDYGSLLMGFVVCTAAFIGSLFHIRSEKAAAAKRAQAARQQQDFAFEPSPAKQDEPRGQTAGMRP